jgi:DNA topoisomerase-1
MPSLVIVESPAKAKTISRFLGPNYRVEASFGHVRDLPEKGEDVPEEIRSRPWGRMAVDVEGDFTPYYVIPRDKQRQVATLRAALKGATEILLATDEDREGESISWHLLQILKPKVPIRRIVFHEITEEAIREALANPRDVDQHLVYAQESRRILDRLYGYSLSPVLWKKVQGGLSAGRVQSVAVRLLVEREEERRAFRKAEYWGLEATFIGDKIEFKGQLARVKGQRIAEGRDFDPATGELKAKNVLHLDGTFAAGLVDGLSKALPWRVSSVEEKPASRQPAAPFTTSTLQQEANRKLGFTSRKTMSIAQRLYEGIDLGGGEREGLITYMRTDSTTLSEKALRQAEDLIKKSYGAEFHGGARRYATKTRNAQEAHEAIRPTDLSRIPKKLESVLEGDDLRLYELIWKRTVASQMADARLKRTSIVIEAKGQNGAAEFDASGTTILFPGFLRAYVEGSDDPSAELGDQETILPALKQGDTIERADAQAPRRLLALQAKQKETQPPARFTEASLIKKLEEEGIGRPSTYATIIGTIQERGYASKRKNALVPSFTAFAVVNLLRKHFADYVDIRFTARLEETLDLIANGEREWKEFVSEFYRGVGGKAGLETRIAAEEPKIEFPMILLGEDPETKLAVNVRLGRYGPYVQRGEGGAGNVASVPGDIAPGDMTVADAIGYINDKSAGPRVLGTHPDTEEKVYAAKGRFGPYVQQGETPEKGSDAPKPRRASLPPGVSEEEVTLDQALRYLALPRDLGKHPDSGAPVLAGMGRFGPYVKVGDEFRSLEEGDDVYTVSLDRAVEIYASPKKFGRSQSSAPAALRELGPSPAGANVKVMKGRYGPYVTDGETNATLPKDANPEDITMERALQLLADRRARDLENGGAKKKKSGFAKKGAPAAKKAAPAKKAATSKKAPAKAKAAPKKKAAAPRKAAPKKA